MSDPESPSLLGRMMEVFDAAGWSYEPLEESGGFVRSLILENPDPDCLVELFTNGRLACQFGVDMEEMRNLLTGDQTEDMQDDELVRVARYHLKPIVDRYRTALRKEGFEEGEDATPDYYAITFGVQLDLSDARKAMHEIARYLLVLGSPSNEGFSRTA